MYGMSLKAERFFLIPHILATFAEGGDKASVSEHVLKKRNGIHSVNLSDLW